MLLPHFVSICGDSVDLCKVVEDNSREHEKQQILVDLKTSLEEAFEASWL